MANESEKLGLKEKVGYGMGDLASNFVFHIVNAFLFSYYTDVLGLLPAAVGFLFLLARFWDGFTDPVMGILADRTNTKFGKYRPFLLWMAVPYGIIGILTFWGPDLSDSGKLAYAYVTYFLLMAVYTAVNVPYSALMGVMSSDPDQRASLSTFRFVGAFLAQVLVGAALIPLLNHFGGYSEPGAWRAAIPFFAAAAVILFLTTFLSTKERVKPQKQARNLGVDFGVLGKNVPLLVMLIVALITLMQLGLRLAITPYYLNYVTGWEGGTVFAWLDRASIFWSSAPIGLVIGLLFTKPLRSMLGKRNALILLTVLNSLAIIVFYWIPAGNFELVIVVNVLGAMIAGPMPALVWAMYTDVVDYGEWKFGSRITALAMATAMLIQKIGLGVGAFINGQLLSFFGYVANVEQTAKAVNGVLLMFSVIPGVMLMSTAVVLLWYRLSDDEVDKITAELAERRSEDE